MVRAVRHCRRTSRNRSRKCRCSRIAWAAVRSVVRRLIRRCGGLFRPPSPVWIRWMLGAGRGAMGRRRRRVKRDSFLSVGILRWTWRIWCGRSGVMVMRWGCKGARTGGRSGFVRWRVGWVVPRVVVGVLGMVCWWTVLVRGAPSGLGGCSWVVWRAGRSRIFVGWLSGLGRWVGRVMLRWGLCGVRMMC